MAEEAAGGEGVPTAAAWVWIVLIIIAFVSFWCQATVTEERFVPALNVIANKFNIPDDIAGATLMAAGASSPELFSSIVALFITHSSLGLGTIVGSEIFNQLVICAGAVFAAKSGRLQLDRAVVTREVGFYALGIVLLYIALLDTREDPDDPGGVDHIYIHFWQACIVFAGYIAYVLVCANMDAIVSCCSGKVPRRDQVVSATKSADYGATSEKVPSSGRAKKVQLEGLADMPFLRERSITKEPVGNFKTVEFARTLTGGKSQKHLDPKDLKRSSRSEADASRMSQRSLGGGFLERSIRGAVTSTARYSDGGSLRRMEFLMNPDKPSDEHGLYDVEFNSFEERLSCFMWQRSYFYNKAYFAVHGWHLRWFTMSTTERMSSVPDRANFERHKMVYPKFREIQVDEDRLIIKVINPTPGKRDFYLMVPSEEVLTAVIRKMEDMMDYQERLAEGAGSGLRESLVSDPGNHENFEESDDHVSLIAFPVGGSNVDVFFFCVLFPLRLVMHYTVPDVRVLGEYGDPTGSLNQAFLAVFMCLVWLVVGSYAMVASLENLAALLDVPDAVVGVTVSAAGTSLPNYVASKVAAQKGFGNMAVSNAFGSNTFNIMVGLGFPWVLYTAFTGFQPYHGLRDEGISESVIILGTVLAVFVVLVVPSGFVIYKWHGILFAVLYVVYLAYEIGKVYWPSSL